MYKSRVFFITPGHDLGNQTLCYCENTGKPERKQTDRRIHRIDGAKTSVPIERKTGQSLPPQGERISRQKIENLFFMKILLFP